MHRQLVAFLVIVAFVTTSIAADTQLPPGAKTRFGTTLHRLERLLECTDLSPDGKDHRVSAIPRLPDVHRRANGKGTETPHRLHFGSARQLLYTPDGKRLITVTQSEVRVLEAATGKYLAEIRIKQEWPAIAASADGKRIAVCRGRIDEKFTYVVWDIDADKPVSEITTTPREWGALALSANGKILATWGRPEQWRGVPFAFDDPETAKTVTFWDADTGKVIHRLTFDRPVIGRRIRFTPDGKAVLIVGETSNSGDTTEWKQLWTVRGTPGSWPGGNPVAFTPDGKRFAVLDYYGTTTIRDTSTGGNATVVPGHGPGYTIRFVANDKAIVLGGEGQNFVAWKFLGKGAHAPSVITTPRSTSPASLQTASNS